MNRHWSRHVFSAAILSCVTAIVAACDRESTLAGPAPVEPTLSAEAAALRTLTRDVALALRDREVRLAVMADMRTSRSREHKLRLSSYLETSTGGGGILLGAITKSTGQSRGSVLDLVRAIRPLEMYLPVREHRRFWQGDAHVFVASQLEENDPPLAFGPSGTSLTLSLAHAPSTTTIMLVPLEPEVLQSAITSGTGTDAGAVIELEDCSPTAIVPCGDDPPTGGGSPGPYPTGLFFNPMVVRDEHEPWTRGEPELEVHILGTQVGLWEETSIPACNPGQNTVNSFCVPGGYYRYTFNPNARRLVPFDCAGEQAAGYHWFNYDGTGSHTNIYDVYFAEPKKFAQRYIAKDKFGRIWDNRVIRLEPPYEIQVLERDDGYACPKPPRRVDFKIEITLSLDPLDVDVDVSNVMDLILFRNNNDMVANWGVATFDNLVAFNNTWLYGANGVWHDADVRVSNHGLSRDVLPLQNVATVTLAPASATIRQGSSVALVATAKDLYGYEITGRLVLWTTSNPVVASISPTGVVTGVGPGQATITVTIDGISTSAPITVLYPAVAVTVSGLSYFGSGTPEGTYTWTANPSGGNGVYTYKWELLSGGTWVLVGTARTYSRYVSGATASFSLRASVTSVGETGTGSVYVFVEPAPPSCGTKVLC